MSGETTAASLNCHATAFADLLQVEIIGLLYKGHSFVYFFVEILHLCWNIFVSQVEICYRWMVPKPRKDVTGKTVLITGAASGIGRQMAIKLGGLGCRMVLWDINEEGNNYTAQMIRDAGGEAYSYTCDVRMRADVSEKAEQLRRDIGCTIDILVNNAGVLVCKDLLQLDEGEIRCTLETNTLAHFWTVKEFLPEMVRNRYGHIVTLSSMSSVLGVAMVTDYSASKFAVIGFAEALEDEIYRMGLHNEIKSTVVCPYMVNTNLLSSIQDRVEQRSRFDRPMEPENVAEQIIDGVLRDHDLIHIPGKTSSMHLMKALMPKKALRYITEFADSGYFPVKRKATML